MDRVTPAAGSASESMSSNCHPIFVELLPISTAIRGASLMWTAVFRLQPGPRLAAPVDRGLDQSLPRLGGPRRASRTLAARESLPRQAVPPLKQRQFLAAERADHRTAPAHRE